MNKEIKLSFADEEYLELFEKVYGNIGAQEMRKILEEIAEKQEIQESLKVTPIELSFEEMKQYNIQIQESIQKLEGLETEIHEAEDVLENLKVEVVNESHKLEELKVELSHNLEFQKMIDKLSKLKKLKKVKKV